MSSQDRREAPSMNGSSRADVAAPRILPADVAATNYPPKARYQDAAMPASHRPMSS